MIVMMQMHVFHDWFFILFILFYYYFIYFGELYFLGILDWRFLFLFILSQHELQHAFFVFHYCINILFPYLGYYHSYLYNLYLVYLLYIFNYLITRAGYY